MEKWFSTNRYPNNGKWIQICTGTLARNLRLWSVQGPVSSVLDITTKAYTMK